MNKLLSISLIFFLSLSVASAISVEEFSLADLGFTGFVVEANLDTQGTAQVLYGKTGALGSATSLASSSREHLLQVNSLQENTVYFYRVVGKNSQGNTFTSAISLTRTPRASGTSTDTNDNVNNGINQNNNYQVSSSGISTKSWQQWKNEFDSKLSSDKQYRAALKSHASTDMYFEGFGYIYPLYRAWQATGDFSYLDKAFEIVESDIDNAVVLSEYYKNPDYYTDGWWSPRLPYKGWPAYPNFWVEKKNIAWGTSGFSFFFPPYDEYIENNDGKEYSYNYMVARDTVEVHTTSALRENIYNRFIADMLRGVYKHPDVLSKISSNGQTYKQRSDKVLAYVETHVWEKWVEYESNAKHKSWFVYRQNTHMSSHLASVALSLYSITNKQKYIDFVNEFLYDFGSSPHATSIPAGIGFLDQLEVDKHGAYVYSANWGRSALTHNQYQDISHAGPEFVFLSNLYEEGIAITQEDIKKMSKTVTHNVIIGDPTTATQVTYLINDGQSSWWNKAQMNHGLYVMAEHDEEILVFLENNANYLSDYAHGLYAARKFSDTPLAYPPFD